MPTGKDELVELTRSLLAFDTTTPLGNERQAMEFCAAWLQGIGFDCLLHPHSESRASLVATRSEAGGQPLCLSGHLDVVPIGKQPWRLPPFEGQVSGDRLFGRGASDMKGAVAAFLLACRETPSVKGGVTILLTAGEETGCDGARWLAEQGLLPEAGAMIVGESTDNRPLAGHKGAYWLKLRTTGKTAHGAMPDLGVNAIAKALPVLNQLAGLDLAVQHPVMGPATCNLGTIHAGLNINSVPDSCEFTLDLRSVKGIDHAEILRRVEAIAGPEVEVEILLDLPSVWTDPNGRWFSNASATIARVTGEDWHAGAASYFTDASILKPAMNDLPVMILGPGGVDQPHTTNESVQISRLVEAVEIYRALLRDWSGEA
jgi:succinyl-diaminopimelate desuccinylase